jgi:agmatine/peptidylarginine deiminase
MDPLVKEILDAGAEKVIIVASRGANLNAHTSQAFRELRRILTVDQLNRLEIIEHKKFGPATVWARDWAPLGALQADGSRLLLDFNYRLNGRPVDDNTPTVLSESLPGYQRLSLPVYNDGGNFMINDEGVCLMTSRTTDDNARSYHSEDMILNADQIGSYFLRFGGCKKVHIFPRIPYEFTGHIDMWAKYLNNDTVLVASLDASTVALEKNSSSRKKAEQIRQYLQARRADLENMGFIVVEVPMPLPDFGREVFRTYTNSLFVGKTALIPKYSSRQYLDSNLHSQYEAKISDAYAKAGFKVRLIESDQMIVHGGAIHCITMQLPRP